MELKSELKKPYTGLQKNDFIIENNHQNGYEIKETDTAIEAWGYTNEEITQQEKEVHILQLKQNLDKLDLKAVRSLRAIIAGTSTEADLEKLAAIENQAQILRSELLLEQNENESENSDVDIDAETDANIDESEGGE